MNWEHIFDDASLFGPKKAIISNDHYVLQGTFR